MKSKTLKRIVSLAAVLVGVFFDWLTKILAIKYLLGNPSVPIWRGVLQLTYVENRGSAFGMFSDRRWVFMVFSVVAIVAIAVYLVKRDPPLLTCVALSLILSGGIGNMIDRIVRGYVVDFVDFCLIHFAVFNFADTLVCVGAGLLVLILILDTVKERKAGKTEKNPTDFEEKEP